MTKNETHKEKMERKKREREIARERADAIKTMKDLTKNLGAELMISSRTPDTYSSVGEDPNRIVVSKNLKSKWYDHNVEIGFKEEFIGGFKTLRNDPFFMTTVSDKRSMKKIEHDCINRGHYFHSTGDFTGIKHIAYWSEEYGCFLAWRLVPERLNTMGMVA